MMAPYPHRGMGILMGALLVLLLAPRGLFHACDHGTAHHVEDGAHVSAPAHCPACDMVVPPFEQVCTRVASPSIGVCVVLDVALMDRVAVGHTDHTSARGPPAMG